MRRTLAGGQRRRRNFWASARRDLRSSLKSKFMSRRSLLARRLHRRQALGLAQRTAALGQLLQQRRRPPAGAVALVPDRHLIIDLARADAVGPIHEPAPVAREAKTVEPHHVDVAGAQRLALFQNSAGFIDRGKQQPPQDFFIRELALPHTQLANSD